MSPPPGTVLVDMRDIRSLRNDLVEVSEEASRQTLAAHTRTLALLADQEQNAALFRAEVRSRNDREDDRARLVDARMATMLRHLEKLVEIPATERETLSPPSWTSRARTRLDSPASTRAVMALAFAGLLASLASCAYPVAHMIGAIP